MKWQRLSNGSDGEKIPVDPTYPSQTGPPGMTYVCCTNGGQLVHEIENIVWDCVRDHWAFGRAYISVGWSIDIYIDVRVFVAILCVSHNVTVQLKALFQKVEDSGLPSAAYAPGNFFKYPSDGNAFPAPVMLRWAHSG